MASLDILVQPSRRETFGRVLIEAMASHKPVIATRIGGMPEIVREGETGILVRPEDPRDLAGAMLELLRDPGRRRTMGDAGRRRVETHFGLPQRIHRLQTIYDQVLGGSARGDAETRPTRRREDSERPPVLTP
jgi:glycosyltransferase involved in cell wall biosynthesis